MSKNIFKNLLFDKYLIKFMNNRSGLIT